MDLHLTTRALRSTALLAFVATAMSPAWATAAAGATGDQVAAWPGPGPFVEADAAGALGGNISGLAVAGPASLWAVRDAPGALLALDRTGDRWTPREGWGSGRALRYPDGAVGPDAEAVTVADAAPGSVFVGAERDNGAPSGRRSSVLRYATAGTGPLTATAEWRLDDLAPTSGPNTGIEGLAWIPDAALTTAGLRDRTGRAYVPSEHPAHHGGLFAIGFEQERVIHLVLLAEDGRVEPVATVPTGLERVMELHWDTVDGELWVACDDACDGRVALLVPRNATLEVVALVAAPKGSASRNDEGLARLPCTGGERLVVRADDSASGGHVLRDAVLPCGPLAAMVAPRVAPASTTATATTGAPSATTTMPVRADAIVATRSTDGMPWAVAAVLAGVGAVAALGVVVVRRRTTTR